MTIVTASTEHIPGRKAAEADLLARFKVRLALAPEEVLQKAVSLKDEKAFAEVGKEKANKERSLETRDQEARARMKARAFQRVQSRCELLSSLEAYGILGVSKQALSQKTQAGQLLAYTNTSNRRKYYPAFQFADNKVRPIIAELISGLGINPADTEDVNFLVQHLVSNMDYSNPGEPHNVVPRYSLLDDSDALEIIKRDYRNAFEPGQ